MRAEIVIAHAAAHAVTATAWMLGFVGIVIVAAAARAIAQGGPFDVFRGRHPFVEIALAAAVFLFVGVLGAASTTSRFARRLRLVAADRASEHGRRPSVLYLRTFDDDHRLLAAGGPAGRAANEVFTFRARVPYEEIVVRELERHGAVAAVAEPNAPRLFLPLGASRKRLSEAEWQDGVLTRMNDAALIVIAIGSTDGLLWELDAVTRNGHLDRVVLVVPPDDEDAIEARWKATVGAITEAGGPALHAPVEPAEILVARLSRNGLREVVVADRRDEHSYSAALDRTLRTAPDEPLERERARAVRDLGPAGQPRDIVLAITLAFLTLGLYALYWLFTTHEEVKRHLGSGLGGEIGLATGVLTGGIGTAFVLPREVAKIYAEAGRPSPVGVQTGLWLVPGALLVLTPFVWFVKVQHALNVYWESMGAERPVTLLDLLARVTSAASRAFVPRIRTVRSHVPAAVPTTWLAKAEGKLERYAADRGDPAVPDGALGAPRGIGFGIALFAATGGLYGWYWAYKTHEELKRHTGSGLGGYNGVFLWIFTMSLVSAFVIPSEIARMYARAGERPPVSRLTGLLLLPGGLLLIPAIVWFVQVQLALNRYWTARSSGPAGSRAHPI